MTKLLFILLLLFGCSPTEPEDTTGCPYPDSCNYNPDGTDEESCWYADVGCLCADGEDALSDECGVCNGDGSSCEEVYGWTDDSACNFNADANIFVNTCFLNFPCKNH